jgi:hypothetical protein
MFASILESRASPKPPYAYVAAFGAHDLQCTLLPAKIVSMEKTPPNAGTIGITSQHEPFSPGALVIATLANPREKFWGMIMALAPAGLSISGVELASFEDLAVMVREGEPFTPAVVFFPMHRIERMELDLPDGSLPSLSERFFSKTGLEPSLALAARHHAAPDSTGPVLHAPEERA